MFEKNTLCHGLAQARHTFAENLKIMFAICVVLWLVVEVLGCLTGRN